jgi:EcsC protein family
MTYELIFTHNPAVRRGAVQESELLEKLFRILFRVIHEIPPSAEKPTSEALLRAHKLIADASFKAAAISGALALPPGPLGWLTILPDLAAIWRLQGQMVADIAAAFGKQGQLTQESMIYCLFRHAAAQVLRDLVTRMGERVVVRRLSSRVAENFLESFGIRLVHRVARRGLWRWLPLVGALAVAGYAYYDTEQVGKTAVEFFSHDIELK